MDSKRGVIRMVLNPKDYEVITDQYGDVTVKRSDGAIIPKDIRNIDYYEFLEIEKKDEKQEIKRTTLVMEEPKPVVDPIVEINARLTKLKSDIVILKTFIHKTTIDTG
jgi:hypothetical protein